MIPRSHARALRHPTPLPPGEGPRERHRGGLLPAGRHLPGPERGGRPPGARRAVALHAICILRLPGPEGELVLKARGVPSALSRTGSGEGATLLYQSGIEFLALTSETLAALRQLLADLAETPASA